MGSEYSSSFQRFMLASGNFFFRFRNTIFPIAIIVLMLFTRPGLFLGNPVVDRVLTGLGLLVVLSGLCFRLLVIGFFHIRRGGKNGRIYAKSLVTEGLYAHTRNPLYVANFLIIVGVGMIYGAPEFFVAAIPFFIFVYSSIVMAEEEYLAERFGAEYEEYVRTVNRFIPDLRGIRKSFEGSRFDPEWVLKKEYVSVYETLIGICFIHLWKTYYLYGFEDRQIEFLVVTIVMIVLTFLFLVVRRMKALKQFR